MDSSNFQIIGGCEEECHSSESGWTMYIGDDDMYEEENDVTEEYKGVGTGGGDFESDDSMISDASSAMAATNTKKSDVDLKKNSRKGKKMAVEKNGNEEKKKKDKESNSSSSINVVPAQSGNKVRRNWIGKKK